MRTGGSSKRLDLLLVVIDDLVQSESLELLGALTKFLDVTFLPWPLRCRDGVAARFEEVDEGLPAAC